MKSWLYNISKTYQENYDTGPDFVNSNDEPLILEKVNLFGKNFNSRIVLSSGPLLNFKHIKAALQNGFVPTYKTVRTTKKECLPFPNVVYVDNSKQINIKDSSKDIVVKNSPNIDKDISITNSFGMPSQAPDEWVEDVKKCQSYSKKYSIDIIYSFVGSGDSTEEMAEDYAKCAKILVDAGATIIEANFSCPNVKTTNGCLFLEPLLAKIILEKIREKIDNKIILGIKVGCYPDEKILFDFLKENSKYINYIAGINTVTRKVMTNKGISGLKDRETSGICGSAITDSGYEFLQQAKKAKDELNLKNLVIISGGGVMDTIQAKKRLKNGADFVGTATMAMWNEDFAKKCYK